MAICGRVMQRKRKTEERSFGNGEAMELKLIKHDKAVQKLKKFGSAKKCASKKLSQAIIWVVLQGYGQQNGYEINVDNSRWPFAGK